MIEQLHLHLDTQPLQPAEGDTIAARFTSFHERNPWVLTALEKLTAQQLAAGQTRVGVGMLFEVLRWHHSLSTSGDPWKLNNDYRALYARALLAAHPEWDGVFETRQLRAASTA